MIVEIEDVGYGGLQRDVWRFSVKAGISANDGITYKLWSYQHEARATKRHGWRAKHYWKRFNTRVNIEKPEIIPLDILQRAKAQIIERVKFV